MTQLLLNVLLSEVDQTSDREKAAVKTSHAYLGAKDKALKLIQDNPEKAARVLQSIIDRRISVEFPELYIIEVAEAIRHKRPIMLMGPHWSQIDVFGFIKIIQEVNAYFKQNGEDIVVRVVGPMSSKFVSTGDLGMRLDEGIFVEVMDKLGLTLLPVIQVQDTEAREHLGEKGADEKTTSGWMAIERVLRKDRAMLGIFPEGTRAVGLGAKRPPVKTCELLQKRLERSEEKNNPALVVPFALLGSHLTWGLEHRNPLHKVDLSVAKPIENSQMTKLVKIVQHYLEQEESKSREFSNRPLHPVEAVYLVSLFNAPEEFWGAYAPAISILRQLVISTTQNGTLDEFITLLDGVTDQP